MRIRDARPDERIPGAHVRVVEEGEEVLGFSALLPVRDAACELDRLFVEPHRRRRGAGRALVEDAARIARERGATRLEVVAEPQARAFLRGVGFADAGEAARMALALPPELGDGSIVLVALDEGDVDAMLELTRDEDVIAYTLARTGADREYVSDWIARYERGWRDGTRAGFSIRDARDRAFLGFAAVVRLEQEERQGELGYMLAPEARGRGAAGRAVALLTRWCFDVLGLERLELSIDPSNGPSMRLAERAGYQLDGVLRSVYFKEGRRADIAVWSRLRGDG